jgi:hypothetical protein
MMQSSMHCKVQVHMVSRAAHRRPQAAGSSPRTRMDSVCAARQADQEGAVAALSAVQTVCSCPRAQLLSRSAAGVARQAV